MYVPMEILSNVTTRTDSGSGVRQRTGSGLENNASRFERMFEKELSKYETRFPGKGSIIEEQGDKLSGVIGENEDNTEEAIAAGDKSDS